MSPPRIAVIGGDERGERTEWPRGYDVRHFATVGQNNAKHIRDTLGTGKYAVAFVMTKWVGHSLLGGDFACETRMWNGSFNELAKAIPNLIPPGKEASNDVDDKWYETHVTSHVIEENPMNPAPAPAPLKKPPMSIEDAVRRVQRDLELLADGLLDDTEALVAFEKILTRGVTR